MAGDKKDVFELGYMRKLRLALDTIAAYPNKAFGELAGITKFLYYYHFLLITLSCLQEFCTVNYVFQNFKMIESSDMALTYVNALLTAVSIQRYLLPFTNSYCNVLRKFVFEFHLMHHKDKTDYTAKVNERVYKICTVFSTIIYIQAIGAIITFNMVPWYNNYRNGRFGDNKPNHTRGNTYEHSVYFELPIDQFNDFGSYVILFLYNWYPSYNVASGFCTFDLLMYTIIFHIWGHLKILLHDLKYFPRVNTEDQSAINSQEESEDLTRRLKDIIQHHQLIKNFIKATFEAFDTTLVITLAFHQITGCVMLLQIADLDAESLGKYGVLTMIVFQQLIQMSIIFELVRSKGDSLADEVYSLPWENMNSKNRKTVLIFLFNVQPTIAFKAGGVVPVGVLTMQSIIRTSCSYFVMLRTFTKE